MTRNFTITDFAKLSTPFIVRDFSEQGLVKT